VLVIVPNECVGTVKGRLKRDIRQRSCRRARRTLEEDSARYRYGPADGTSAYPRVQAGRPFATKPFRRMPMPEEQDVDDRIVCNTPKGKLPESVYPSFSGKLMLMLVFRVV
jgi:hypothetical protein